MSQLKTGMIKVYTLTDSDEAAVTSSCKARTERACSMTKTHCDKSGGAFCRLKQKNRSYIVK
jgi:hypothetical protein